MVISWSPLACCSVLVLQVCALQWSSCGDKADTVQLTQLNIVPEILKLPGPITVSAIATLRENITGPIQVNMEVRKKMFWGDYVRIPCEDGFGSCTYDNACAFSPYTDMCPTAFDKYHLPCKCPIKQGSYKVKDFPVQIKSIHIPKFLVNGKYKIHITITSRGQEMGCYDVQLSLK